MNILQHTILPQQSSYDENIGLYFHSSEKVRLMGNVLRIPPYQKVDFDTYFNYFSVRKWVDFGQIDSLFIGGNLCGVAILEIIGIAQKNGQTAQKLLDRITVGTANEWQDFYHRIDNFKDCDVLFVRAYTLDGKCELGLLEFGTDTAIKRKVSLGICLDDNDGVLLGELERLKANNGLDMTIIQSDNLTDGIRQLYQKENVSHILTLSAANFVNGETVFRTVRFFEMVFAERSDVVVAGVPMFALSDNDDLLNNPLNAVLKGGSKQNTLDFRLCAFDKKIVRDFGLPLALSDKYSASEYQNRIHKEIVPINGVAFYQDLSPALSLIQTEYHQFKDNIINELLTSKPNLDKLKSLIWDRFWHNIHTYHYIAARLNLYALDHIAKGTYKLPKDDIDRMVERLYLDENRFVKRTFVGNDANITASNPNDKQGLFHRIRPYLSLSEFNIINIKKDKSPPIIRQRDKAYFTGEEKVLIVDETGNAEIARIRRKKAAMLIKHAAKSHYRFAKNYTKIRLDLLKYRNEQKQI